MNHWMNHFHEWMNQWMNHWINHSYEWMNHWINECVKKQVTWRNEWYTNVHVSALFDESQMELMLCAEIECYEWSFIPVFALRYNARLRYIWWSCSAKRGDAPCCILCAKPKVHFNMTRCSRLPFFEDPFLVHDLFSVCRFRFWVFGFRWWCCCDVAANRSSFLIHHPGVPEMQDNNVIPSIIAHCHRFHCLLFNKVFLVPWAAVAHLYSIIGWCVRPSVHQ